MACEDCGFLNQDEADEHCCMAGDWNHHNKCSSCRVDICDSSC